MRELCPPRSISIDIEMPSLKDEFWILLTSDRHFDSPSSDLAMQRRHLKMIQDRGGCLLDFGDLCDIMQGRKDRRQCKSALKPELKEVNYTDLVVDEAVKFLAPYKDSIALLTRGNHETSILTHLETDITGRICDKLGCLSGPYCGWVRLQVSRGAQSAAQWLYYHHGPDKGGIATRGVLSTGRMAAYAPDADIVVSGHSHDTWALPIPRDRISREGVPFIDRAMHVRTPSYKDEWSKGSGWAVEKGGGPKTKGAIMLRLFWFKDGNTIRLRNEFTLIE